MYTQITFQYKELNVYICFMKQYKDSPYFVTNDGKIFGVKGYQLKLNANSSGYFNIYSSRLKKNLTVHRMVAELYVPNPLNKPYINHIDGNRLNNHYSNLEWVTQSENMIHCKRILGKTNRILSNEDIDYIKKNYKAKHRKFGAIPLANKFGISMSGILYHIKNK